MTVYSLWVSAKAKGTRNEHRSRRLLEIQGYRVTRAAGSMGGMGPDRHERFRPGARAGQDGQAAEP